jgi:hypothetical protein
VGLAAYVWQLRHSGLTDVVGIILVVYYNESPVVVGC